jgi:hypothetical protein
VSRMSDLLATGYIGRHCTEPQCAKCIARARWYRRKARRSENNKIRKNTRRR